MKTDNWQAYSKGRHGDKRLSNAERKQAKETREIRKDKVKRIVAFV